MSLSSNSYRGPFDAQMLNARALENDEAQPNATNSSSLSCFAFIVNKLRTFGRSKTSFGKLNDVDERSMQGTHLESMTKRMLGVRKRESTRVVASDTNELEGGQEGQGGQVYQLETVLERLNAKQQTVQNDYDKKKQQAKRFLERGMRKEALNTMRSVKMLESQLKALRHNCDVIMSQIVTLGNLEMQQEVASVMSTSLQHAKKANETLEQVTQMEDVLLEAKDIQEDIESAMEQLAQNMLPGAIDESELLAELEDLGKSDEGYHPEATQQFPTVPSDLPATAPSLSSSRTDSFAQLQAASY